MADQTDFHPVQYLPFVRSRDNPRGRDFWQVPGTGDYALDCALGEGLALHALRHLALYPSHNLLGDIVKAQILHREFGGIEISFWVGINRALLASLQLANIDHAGE